MGQGPSSPSGDEPTQPKRCDKRLRHRSISSLAKSCHFTRQTWLPLDELEKVVTVENVNASATLGPSLCRNDNAYRVVRDAPCAFAILLWCGCQNIIEALLQEGFKDTDLPLTRTEVDARFLSSKDGKIFWAFKEIKDEEARDRAIDDFLDRQWSVLAPVFEEESNADESTIVHQVHAKSPLPLSNKKHITRTAMSRVSSCDLHPYHYRHQGERVHDHPIQVAVKELGEDEKTFEKETQNLLRIRQFNNPHLIRHIAACKVDTSPSPTYYVIFPLASGGDLHAYWQSRGDQHRTPDLVRWSLEQMLGLATAVRDLHTTFEDGSNCRHGDLKPLNILVFEEDGTCRLVIADLGIAKVHSDPTAVRTQKATETLATTRAYEAPEAHKKCRGHNLPRPRAYDVWSLGCILLEFTIWLLFDMRAVESFASRRPDTWTESRPGGFYALEEDGSPVVSEVVDTAIATLLKDERCGESTVLGRLVQLIARKMLAAESKDRVDAVELVEELENIVRDAAQSGDEFLWKAESTPEMEDKLASTVVPEVFRPLSKGSGTWSVTQ
ncbi:kinase-like domain-containing protein [Cercophora newfieldiana]|uniref:Kinase-like domain-containing protein n=1 Tax=Cercophora newfieldiana TaxID=92897 RepID=A0AA39YF11_9PEZI|nr:kinase-like domain-containing protein [Cercophora newfieldiana]